MNNDFEPIQYGDTLHYQLQEKRRQIAERINTAITQKSRLLHCLLGEAKSGKES